MMEGARLDQDYITNCLVGDEQRARWDIEHRDSFRQLSLFDDMHIDVYKRQVSGMWPSQEARCGMTR